MAQNLLAPMMEEMLKEYPGLTVNLVTGISAPDLIADGLDMVIRGGALRDSNLFSKRLGSMPMVVCAAKSYLLQHDRWRPLKSGRYQQFFVAGIQRAPG
ncbi:lysR substrate binding domain protein [Candidatus Erwinia dacicola]|uniref:LysR substrate binding domain protein n=1 Tax=Candidatus Erwinia dacicola TaxID=252393 RepID=A0A328TJZ5_9GAMM|nr:lysR substrate binding domain protein [Candidatus Erwinia dacicola]